MWWSGGARGRYLLVRRLRLWLFGQRFGVVGWWIDCCGMCQSSKRTPYVSIELVPVERVSGLVYFRETQNLRTLDQTRIGSTYNINDEPVLAGTLVLRPRLRLGFVVEVLKKDILPCCMILSYLKWEMAESFMNTKGRRHAFRRAC